MSTTFAADFVNESFRSIEFLHALVGHDCHLLHLVIAIPHVAVVKLKKNSAVIK